VIIICRQIIDLFRFCPSFPKYFKSPILITYFNKYDILYRNQYGFRKGHSTSLALHHLFDNITKAADQKEYTIGVFIDLSKAFDTVIHEISINKLIKALWNDGTRNDDVCTRLYLDLLQVCLLDVPN
jgi:hypothetical protein